MPEIARGGRICPCGATLITRADCLASDDEILRHVGETYLTDATGYCAEEDDVVPLAWAFRTEADRQRWWANTATDPDESPF